MARYHLYRVYNILRDLIFVRNIQRKSKDYKCACERFMHCKQSYINTTNQAFGSRKFLGDCKLALR